MFPNPGVSIDHPSPRHRESMMDHASYDIYDFSFRCKVNQTKQFFIFLNKNINFVFLFQSSCNVGIGSIANRLLIFVHSGLLHVSVVWTAKRWSNPALGPSLSFAHEKHFPNVDKLTVSWMFNHILVCGMYQHCSKEPLM